MLITELIHYSAGVLNKVVRSVHLERRLKYYLLRHSTYKSKPRVNSAHRVALPHFHGHAPTPVNTGLRRVASCNRWITVFCWVNIRNYEF